MKEKITDFIHHLLIYDYLLFGGIILLFILTLVFAILMRRKMGLAVFLVLTAFGILTAGPVIGYIQLHRYLFSHKVLLEETKKLEFTEALLLRGSIENLSKRPFHECTVTAGVYKVTHYPYVDPIYPYIPFKRSALHLTKTIQPGESAPFKLFIEPFRYTKDYNITIKADCR